MLTTKRSNPLSIEHFYRFNGKMGTGGHADLVHIVFRSVLAIT
jgi:hypothetical protein